MLIKIRHAKIEDVVFFDHLCVNGLDRDDVAHEFHVKRLLLAFSHDGYRDRRLWFAAHFIDRFVYGGA